MDGMTATTDQQLAELEHPDTLLDLLDPVERPQTLLTADTLEARYHAFADANPHVYRALERLASQWFSAGHHRVGIKALYERLRWEYGVQTGHSPRLNNSWTAFYARDLIGAHPEWRDRILTRERRTA